MRIRSSEAIKLEEKDLKEEDLVSIYINIDIDCICCSTETISYDINKAYLDGYNYKEIISMFSERVKEKTGKKLSNLMLSKHFNNHFDIKGAAIAEYNEKYKKVKSTMIIPTNTQKDLFDLMTESYIDDLELLDLSVREQLNNAKEIQEMINNKKSNNSTFGIDNLIMKKQTIVSAIFSQVVNKAKMINTGELEKKKVETLNNLNFIFHRIIGIEVPKALEGTDPKFFQESENLYLRIVIKNFLKALKTSLDKNSDLFSSHTKTILFSDLKSELDGIEEKIINEFNISLKGVKEKFSRPDETKED